MIADIRCLHEEIVWSLSSCSMVVCRLIAQAARRGRSIPLPTWGVHGMSLYYEQTRPATAIVLASDAHDSANPPTSELMHSHFVREVCSGHIPQTRPQVRRRVCSQYILGFCAESSRDAFHSPARQCVWDELPREHSLGIPRCRRRCWRCSS